MGRVLYNTIKPFISLKDKPIRKAICEGWQLTFFLQLFEGKHACISSLTRIAKGIQERHCLPDGKSHLQSLVRYLSLTHNRKHWDLL